MIKIFKTTIRPLLRRFGFDVVRYGKKAYPPDISNLSKEVFYAVKPFTQTNLERVTALTDAVQYVVKNEIDGAMVECGVWNGGQ